MSLVLEYLNDHRTAIVQQEFLKRKDPTAAERYYRGLLINAVVLVAACYASYDGQNTPLLAVFVTLLLLMLVRGIPYSKIEDSIAATMASFYPTRRHRLEISDRGLHETVEGIQSYVPWQSVLRFAIHRGVLLIELNGGLWAMVPSDSLFPSSGTLEQAVQELRKRGVLEGRYRYG